METGKFKTPAGEILNVVQTNEENRQVLVDYGERRAWHPEEEYLTWEKVEEEQAPTTEVVKEKEAKPAPKKPAKKKGKK